MMTLKKLAPFAITGFSLLAASAASAADSSELTPISRTVEYGDLDLASVKGQQRFETRIKYAVKMVCQDSYARTLQQKALANQCKAQAMEGAMKDAKIAIANFNKGRFASGQMVVAGN
ncbi:UrcA family protein [Sphingorhabdus arenilitoris]|uniref:UrcA family protein n=1 Tax=Sphingorhabdus arenilitoris TaxID=1490041 RepID=A0ABV8RIH0_9SPHN